MSSLSSAMFSADCPPFVPTSEWQPILTGQSVPAGLWMRMDISTGVRQARLMPVAGEAVAQQQQGGGQPYAISGTESEPRAVCAAFVEAEHQLPADHEGTTSAAFFAVYAPLFERYAVFSRKTPAPSLGSADSSDSAVLAFYKFWCAFSSCRELPLDADDVASPSGGRSQLQQREHEKRQQAARHQETTIVRRLAADAQRKDPRAARIKKQLDEQNQAQSAARQAKRDAEQAAEQQRLADAAAAKDELARQQAADAAAQADRELAARAAEEEGKKAARDQQKRLRAAFGKACRAAGGLDELHIDYLRASLSTEQLQPITDAFAAEAQSAQGKALFASHLAALLAVEQAAAEAKAQAQAASAALAQQKKDAAASLVWSDAEHAALARGVAKYTHGVALRWHKIADLVNAVAVRPRDLSDVIAHARALERAQGPLGFPPGKGNAAEAEAPTAAAATAAASSVSPPPAARPAAAAVSPSPEPVVSSPSPSASPVAAAAAAASSTSTGAAAAAASSSSSFLSLVPFNVTEQQRLEYALQTVSKTAPDRWQQIADIVSTRSKKECMARYKSIVAHLKAEKQQQTGE